jgi:deoxyribonuclease V
MADLPSIGVAKTWLLGEHEPPPPDRGAWQPLRDGGEVVGAALRTRTGVRPVYVSAGHRVSLATAVRLTLATAPRFRLPEPLRRAHRLASAAATAATAPAR